MIPTATETQPEFAIRFHTGMVNSIPDTRKRNAACFAAWEQHRGPDPIVRDLVESRFPADQYKRLPNVALFHEHTVPEQEIEQPGGQKTKVAAQKYGRDELAEMVAGMNDRIIEHDEFSPISCGHTSPKPGANGEREIPKVLGFAGPYRLGMIGRKSPKWAIFGDEYHFLDFQGELRQRVGRSPEVWRYSRMRDRFFYPIAALGSEMPRLNLPPAHYSRRSSDSTPVFVECYQATFPGGSNTFVPGFTSSDSNKGKVVDQYSSPAAESPNTALIQELLSALFETQPFQFLFHLMKEAGQGGSPNPAVQNEIPPDETAQPVAPAPDAAVPVAQAPTAPAAPAVPAMPPEQKRPDNYSRELRDLQDEKAELLKELSEFRRRANQAEAEKTRIERYSRLRELAEDFCLKPDVEIERVAGYTPEQFDAHCQIITENYQRSLSNVPDLGSLSVGASPSSGPVKPAGELTKDDLSGIERYCIEHDCSFADGRELYLRERAKPLAS